MRPTRIIPLILLAAMLTAGCTYQEELRDAQAKLAEADAAVLEAEVKLTELQEAVKAAETLEEKAEARKADIRRLYAAQAAQLAELDGAAADALALSMQALQSELDRAKDDSSRAAEVAAAATKAMARVQADGQRGRAAIDEQEARLAELHERASSGMAQALGLVDVVAGVIPGGAAYAPAAKGLAGWGLAALTGVGAIERTIAARRRKKGEAAATDERNALAKIVQVNEKLGLVVGSTPQPFTPDQIEAAKTEARGLLTPEAHDLLRVIKALPFGKLPQVGASAPERTAA